MRVRLLCGSAACGLLIAACGGSSSTGHRGMGDRYGPHNSPYAVARCMRANGLSQFPDPSQGSGGIGFPGGLVFSNTGELVVNGIGFSGPALKRAESACKAYLPPGGPPPVLSAQQRAQQLRLAQCMRAHGVPNFPDPGSGGPGGGAAVQVPLPGSNSPAFNHALQVCGKRQGMSVHAPG